MMSERKKLPPASRSMALLVLGLALAATFFGVWREHELVRRDQIIQWQDSLDRVRGVMQSLIWQRFGVLNELGRVAFRHEENEAHGWDVFLAGSEWQERFPGMQELGFAELTNGQWVVKFAAGRPGPAVYPPGFDFNGEAAIREALQKTTDAGYGIGSPAILRGTNWVVVGMFPQPLKDVRPGTVPENRANLRGIIFFVLDQQAFFRACEPKLTGLPLSLRLLSPDEPTPVRTETQRYLADKGAAGEWRFVETIKAPPVRDTLSQWIVLTGGTSLSFLLFFLFTTQAQMRQAAEQAKEALLTREAEITGLNRDLEEKIATRTAELKVALAEEKELNRLKSNFISMVTHEIRTPLGLILSSSEILSRYHDRLPPEKRGSHLRTIDSAVERMSSLMEDVLLFSKAEAGRMEFNPVALDLPAFCTQLLDEITSATNRRCPFELCVAPCPPARADDKLLRHIFANLLTNAVKYSPAGKTVQFFVAADGGEAVFTVRDQGMGISEADRQRLFTPFYRGRNVVTIQGTGLGLVIVKRCVEQHGGTMTIASRENEGTTVTVRLPLFSPAHTEFIQRQSQNESL